MESKAAGSSTMAVVINVDTYPVTALALLSLRCGCSVPILLLDCSRRKIERARARALARHLSIDYQSAPLRPHGITLDWLFGHLAAERVLLVDSDAELLDPDLIELLDASTRAKDCFGAGFVQETSTIGQGDTPYAVYMRRMWIPFCMLRTSLVRKSLAAGRSFDHFKVYNDVPALPGLSRLLSLRNRLPMARRWSLKFLDRFRNEFYGVKPSIVYHDTGAEIFSWLLERGYRFDELAWERQREMVLHHHGVTRRRLNRFDNNSASPAEVAGYARRRIEEHYAHMLPVDLLP
ncbi:MAG: hypothetical protein RQ741_09325 [Wenzhouxiangellaceae bacterium]|nr:hypothetical protein [Wenzhouxiangellaceae bacterium]